MFHGEQETNHWIVSRAENVSQADSDIREGEQTAALFASASKEIAFAPAAPETAGAGSGIGDKGPSYISCNASLASPKLSTRTPILSIIDM
jgi:hypothetical protein